MFNAYLTCPRHYSRHWIQAVNKTKPSVLELIEIRDIDTYNLINITWPFPIGKADILCQTQI